MEILKVFLKNNMSKTLQGAIALTDALRAQGFMEIFLMYYLTAIKLRLNSTSPGREQHEDKIIMSKRASRNRSFVRSFNQVQQELDRPTNGLIVLVGIIIVAMILVGLVWQKVKVTQLAQEIEQLEKQLTYFKETNEKLQGKVLFLSREDRIVNIARTKLSMTYPAYEMVTVTGGEKKSGN